MLRYTRSGKKHPDFTTSAPSNRLNWEFYAVVDGECAPVFDNGETPQLQSSTLWILPPNLSYGWTGKRSGWERILFHFGFIPDTLNAQIPDGQYFQKKITTEDILAIRELANETEKYVLEPNELSNLVFHRALIDLSLIALKDLPLHNIVSLDDIAYQRVQDATSWYISNMSKAPTIEAVSSAINISTSHLRRHFHKVKHCSPNIYFQKMRMERACKLLNKTTDTLDQIARSCGFPNSSDFCRAFRKFFQTTPHTWRKRINPKQPFSGLEIANYDPGDKRQNGYFTMKNTG
jgi:AraC family transcriptional regulator